MDRDKDFRLEDRLALTLSESARALGISERHLRSCLHEIPHTRIGRRIIIPVDTLREWLNERVRGEGVRVDRIVEDMMQDLDVPSDRDS